VVLELPVAVPAEEADLAAGVLELPVAVGPVEVQVVSVAAVVLGLELEGRVLAAVPGEPVVVVAAVGLLPQQLLLA